MNYIMKTLVAFVLLVSFYPVTANLVEKLVIVNDTGSEITVTLTRATPSIGMPHKHFSLKSNDSSEVLRFTPDDTLEAAYVKVPATGKMARPGRSYTIPLASIIQKNPCTKTLVIRLKKGTLYGFSHMVECV